ncbi:hypothetical protein [Cupriavidus campinensis]|uniref:hypothetical protein n=1 Tax=Cupriavidus campinensis TaxID=151783 RepID=UPI00164292B0|nr:hypothetical protein [Cupriavidus campinensis]
MPKQKSMTTTYNTSTAKSKPATSAQVRQAQKNVEAGVPKGPLSPYKGGKRK